VHPSNYRIEGFTREVGLHELVSIGRDKGIPTMMDLGSGCLVDLAPYGLTGETTVQEVIASGVDLVTFSGDKLLGGPQAGILAGRADIIEKVRTNPLARALRIDKLTLAALEATLEEYTRPHGPQNNIPTLAMIARSPQGLLEIAERLVREMTIVIGGQAEVHIEQGIGRVGGGALPLGDLPGPRVAIRPRHLSAGRVEQNLRQGDPPVIVLVKEDTLLIDPRTLLPGEPELMATLLAAALEAG
jgi:L-seryl-tRNA(Ser) seleniumtransferase